MEKVHIFRAAKGISFLLVFCLFFNFVSCALVNPETKENLRHYQYVGGYFQEPDNTLDAVFIGPSNVYSSWIASLAWKEYGIAVRYLASAALGGDCFKTIIQNIRDRQPNALYVVCMNSFLSSSSVGAKHDLFDYWPTARKIQPVLGLYNEDLISSSEMLELFIPLIRFHSRWPLLQKEDFNHKLNGLKGESVYLSFLGGKVDVSDGFYVSEKREALEPIKEKILNDFLSYCKESNINILFVGTPWAVDEKEKSQINYINDIISNRGFDSVNLANDLNEIGLNSATDYYDNRHTNIHGAIKVTDYLGEYLVENYTFPEKAGGGG